jgi:protein phosphatase
VVVANRGRDHELAADAHILLPERRFLAVVRGIGPDPRAERSARRVVAAARSAAQEAFAEPLRLNLLSALDWTSMALRQRPWAVATFTGLLFVDEAVHLVHIGNSRCYRMRSRELARISADHTFAEQCVRERVMTPEQAARSPVGGLLTRALGAADAEVDATTLDARPGDTFLLATPGLHLFVADEAIAAILDGERDLERAAVRLAQAASAGGRHFDVTAILARVG